MKSKINLLLLATVTTISFSAIGQTEVSITQKSELTSGSADSKVITGTIILPEKLMKNFTREFPTAHNPKWTTAEDAYFSSFTEGERSVSASFSKKGQFVYALIYGKGTDLPPSIQQGLKKDYPAATVYKVIEMRKPGFVGYQVILQNTKEYINLDISEEGHIQEAKRINKAES
jgi:hypothetical protein